MMFCTVVNCIDGRTQEPAIVYLKERFGADYVDSITEHAPAHALADAQDPEKAMSIMQRTDISVKKHQSKGIAIVAHAECEGNPYPKDYQLDQLRRAVECVKHEYANIEVIGLWLGMEGAVTEFEMT